MIYYIETFSVLIGQHLKNFKKVSRCREELVWNFEIYPNFERLKQASMLILAYFLI